MIPNCAGRQGLRRWIVGCLCLPVGAALPCANAAAAPPALEATVLPELRAADSSPPSVGEAVPEVFTRATAIAWALQNNPELAAVRQQHGIAAAAVVIAKTYPFNPVWTNKLFGVSGRDVSNRLAMEQRVSIDLELRGQGRYRRQAACAALSRTEWEIIHQETLLAVRVIRAFDNVVYHQAKLRLAEEGLRLQEETAGQVRKLIDAGRLRSPDLMLALSEVDSFGIVLDTARSAHSKAESDLRAALGLTSETVKVEGTLQPMPVTEEPQSLLAAALERRPDLHARQAAVREAEGRLRLAVADRFGNLNIGPDYEYNESRDHFIGTQLTVPLPVCNTHRGEILQRDAERTRAAFDLRNAEVTIQQQLCAALNRLSKARALVESYRTRVLPNLEEYLKNMETLFDTSNVDLLKVIDIRRKLLVARSGHLDALFELRQARDDLAAAVADPVLALDSEAEGPVP
jgi:cobalt-zinc-cadmium efflux system outer membrane protein